MSDSVPSVLTNSSCASCEHYQQVTAICNILFSKKLYQFFFPLAGCIVVHQNIQFTQCSAASMCEHCFWLRSQQHSDWASPPVRLGEIFSNLPLRQPVTGQSRRHTQQLLPSGKVKTATVHQWPHRPIYRITQEESKQKARDVASIAECQRRTDVLKLFSDMCSLLPL